ncbi:hypothetical protein BKA70DRAFT_1221481 [Coprinopsis sp. MPI-PUGE-AT-0042]|nr:hypothetical protein BKA70DRAFT_1221481 [Coprinopsis sp. MPI-PUGE-AT-0042]
MCHEGEERDVHTCRLNESCGRKPPVRAKRPEKVEAVSSESERPRNWVDIQWRGSKRMCAVLGASGGCAAISGWRQMTANMLDSKSTQFRLLRVEGVGDPELSEI